jgi:hypothetical protein
MPPDALAVPFRVAHHEPSGLFAVDATVTGWAEGRRGPGQRRTITLTFGTGTFQDADRGVFPLDGLALTLRVAGSRLEPVVVRNPGVLSEFQQEGLLDALISGLEADGRPFPPLLPGEAA